MNQAKKLILLTISLIFTALLFSCNPDLTGTRYALIIGISDYTSINDLQQATNDAVAITDKLTQSGFIVETLLDSAAKKTDILNTIKNINTKLKPEDTFLFFYSGHGESIKTPTTVTYICPSDLILYNTDTYLSETELFSEIDDLDCINKIAILDSCYSGGFVTNSFGLDYIPPSALDYKDNINIISSYTDPSNLYSLGARYLGTSKSKNPIIIISAAGANEKSWETTNYAHGVFTYFLLKSTELADLDSSGYISLTEAYYCAYANIVENWNKIDQNTPFLPHFSDGPIDYVLFKAGK